MIIQNPNQIRLCRKGSCCPIIERFSDDQFTIVDDFKGKIQINKEQLSILKEAIEHFEKNV